MVTDFERDMGVEVTTTIYFTNLPDGVAGRCFTNLNVVQIDLDTYMTSSNLEQRALLYHELGHCQCDLGHDSTLRIFCSLDLMYPSMQSYFCYKNHWSSYVKRMKSQCQK